MALITIKHRVTAAILFSLEAEPNAVRITLEAGVKADANLTDANLADANLRGANLLGANLLGADLTDADLRGADMTDAKNAALLQARLSIVPESGAFDGWKKCRNGVLVHLKIRAEAARSNATGRKCRAECADVLAVIGADEGVSIHDGNTIYRAGERVTCNKWDDNRWNECSGGIHFYLTRIEAEHHT